MVKSRLQPFSYYGGKHYQLNWLLPLLDTPCDHFVEPFCGSAIVTLSREPVFLETINDIDGDVFNFFQVLRDRSDELISKLSLTPYARDERRLAEQTTDDSVEKARRFFFRAQASFGCVGGWSYNAAKRGGCSHHRFLRSIDKLEPIVTRLRLIQIENQPALKVIKARDTEKTLIYCDPPYMPTTRVAGSMYRHEMPVDEHRQLAELLLQCKSKVAISGYRCKEYDDWYRDWQRHDRSFVSRFNISERTESLWTNY